MAYNLAQPGADAVMSVRRFDTWGLVCRCHLRSRSASMGCAGIRRGGAAGIRGLPVARGRV
nr:hypothetical protein [Stenotrophomonas maltophilia]